MIQDILCWTASSRGFGFWKRFLRRSWNRLGERGHCVCGAQRKLLPPTCPSAFRRGMPARSDCRAILGNPQLIICDEATSALDVSVQAQVVSLLKRLQREQGTAYLFITHDLILAQGICSRIAVMYQGRLVECGDAQRIIHSPLHPYTQMLVSCILPPRVTTGFSPMAYERLARACPGRLRVLCFLPPCLCGLPGRRTVYAGGCTAAGGMLQNRVRIKNRRIFPLVFVFSVEEEAA